ncbi:hypothetical protein D3OALGA1CA_1731 [Olavius algarvensis associated proteobacterium Delta 3]|nr:hypothetical protein D3OALGB2SA_1167 [Olavius algarvensis associated proteobacterium Delta 3]CAB5106024.1 hypothetical protein D3OALGA1CA_1731 [Olavius algarvensis associated proteobacterium Delta 3]
MRWIVCICVTAIMILFASVPLAEMYSWTDENGVKNYSNEPPPEGVEASSSWKEVVSAPSAVEDGSGQEGAADQRETKVTRLGNGVIVPVTFGYKGRQINMKLLVDTGAEYTAVYEPATETYQLDKFIPLKALVAGGGVVDAKGLKVEYLRVGPKTQKDAKVVVIKQTGAPTDYNGLLGMSFLADYKHYIDLERKVIVWIDD